MTQLDILNSLAQDFSKALGIKCKLGYYGNGYAIVAAATESAITQFYDKKMLYKVCLDSLECMRRVKLLTHAPSIYSSLEIDCISRDLSWAEYVLSHTTLGMSSGMFSEKAYAILKSAFNQDLEDSAQKMKLLAEFMQLRSDDPVFAESYSDSQFEQWLEECCK